MAHHGMGRIQPMAIAATLSLICFAQTSTSQTQTQAVQPQADQPGYMLHTYTRLVNLEVVVKDSKGNHIQGLKPDDFAIEEQTPIKSKKTYLQKIAEFREVHMASMAAPVPMQPAEPAGSYTNALSVRQDPVPPTIILVDGLNTPLEYQAQVHVQMLKMLRQLPANVPVAVFLLGDRLTLLQGFTSDPRLLQAALSKAYSAAGVGLQFVDPRDDPNSVSSLLAEIGGGHGAEMVAALTAFDQKIYTGSFEDITGRTIHALTSLGHNVEGYPGRKNLLWISTSFPISLGMIEAVGGGSYWDEAPNYTDEVKYLGTVLSNAKVAVYPVNPAGVETLQVYQAGARLTTSQTSPLGFAQSADRDVMTMDAKVDTMHAVADDTGGIVCTGDNDLGDCVRKAVDDSSDFYEIAYYSDSPDWNGDFRKIELKTAVKGAHLEYRTGYYATPEGNPDSKIQSAELQSDCDDYLDATAVTFTAKDLPPASPDQLKFELTVDPSALTFAPAADGSRQLNLDIAVCTYNEKDWPIKLMNYPVNMKLSEHQFDALMSSGKLTDSIFVPGPKPAALRLLVKDVTTGKLGSVYIKTVDLSARSGDTGADSVQTAKQ